MALLLKFPYALIIFISLLFVVTNGSKHFRTIFLFILSYLIHNISLSFSNIHLFLFKIAAQFLCGDDSDCPRDLCAPNCLTLRCVNYICQCG